MLDNNPIPVCDAPSNGITLCCRREDAKRINAEEMEKLTTPGIVSTGQKTGIFPMHELPVPISLTLRIGSRVMVVCNGKRQKMPGYLAYEYVNGEIGTICGFDENQEIVCMKMENGRHIKVKRSQWSNIRYVLGRDENGEIIISSEEIGRIMENIPSDTMVLVDEAYASFITSDTDYIAPLVNKYNNLIISRTLSKFYGLPGLRCGFGFIGEGHEQFLSYSNKYLGFNRFSEAVALAALESDEHYRRVADDMEWGRQLYKKELGDLPGFKVYKSVANFILIKYPIEIKDALMEALKIQDYKIKFMTDKGLESCLRITLGRKEQTQVVVDTIKKVFNER